MQFAFGLVKDGGIAVPFLNSFSRARSSLAFMAKNSSADFHRT